MSLNSQISKHFRDVHFGGNWTTVNLKEQLSDVSWEQATTKVEGMNTIAALTYHIHYFVNAALQVLMGKPLDAHDKFSFDHPPVQSREEWEELVNKCWNDAEQFAHYIDQLPENKLWEDFSDKKYGNYYRNIHGIIEHCHYHLGQIVILKKLTNKI